MEKKMKIWFYLSVMAMSLLIIIYGCSKDDDNNSITDIDGNVYTSVTIGTQVWMVENLKVTHYRNGDPIPSVTDNAAWNNLTTGAYCDYDNVTVISTTYGKLYNFYTITDSRNLCPIGWHIPTEAEWTELIDYLGGETLAGGKLKAIGTIEEGDGLWYSPNLNATNETGFTALPGGHRSSINFFDINYSGIWWSSSEPSSDHIWYCYINYDNGSIGNAITNKKSGFAIRCLRD